MPMFILRLESNREICKKAKRTIKGQKSARNIPVFIKSWKISCHPHNLTSSGLSCGDLQHSRADRCLRLLVLSWSLLSFWPNSSSREWRSIGNSSSPGVAPFHTLFLPSTFSLGMRSQFSFLSRLRLALSDWLKGEENPGGGGSGGGGGGGGGGESVWGGSGGATSSVRGSMAVTPTVSGASVGRAGCVPWKARDSLMATVRLISIKACLGLRVRGDSVCSVSQLRLFQ